MAAAFPSFLWALAAAAIPLILYLLFRRRRKDVSWGALYILRKVLETKSRQRAWLQYLIVALRTLALIALVLIPAGLFLAPRPPAPGTAPAAPRSTHRLILLDTSDSMQARYDNSRALDGALGLTRDLVQGGRYPGTVDILPLHGAREEPVRFTAFPVEESLLEEHLVTLASQTKPMDLKNTLKQAVGLFRESPWARRELVILSDFNQRDFTGAEAGHLDALRDMGVAIYPVSFRTPDAWNFALLDITPGSDLLLANQPALFRLTIGCYGQGGTAQTRLTIATEEGEPLHEHALTMAPGEKQLTIPLALPAGQQTLRVRLQEDSLDWDNEAARTFVVRPELTVMVVQNISVKTGFDNPRTWLARALADVEKREASVQDKSQGEAAAVNDPSLPFRLNLESKIPEQIVGVEALLSADLVLVLDSAKMPTGTIEAFRRYALQGGTVLLAPGPEDSPDAFNKTFEPLAPALLRPPRKPAIQPEDYEHAVSETGDILLRELESTEHGNLGSPRFYNSFDVDAEGLFPDSRILLGLSEGAPLLLERRLGRGRCLLWTAGLSGDWHSMVVHPSYPVFLIRLAQQAAADRSFPRNLPVGAPILAETAFDSIKVIRPDGQEHLLDALAVGTRRFVRYGQTDLAGRYEVRPAHDPAAAPLVFNRAREGAESDLRPLAADIREGLERSAGSMVLNGEQELGRALAAAYPGPPLAGWCLLALVACLVLEAGLARRFFA